MIDKILDLRHAPITEELLSDPSRTSAAWKAHMAAIDACLDLLVPAVKAVASLPEDKSTHDGYCVDKRRVTAIVGRPPVSRILPSYRTQRGGGSGL